MKKILLINWRDIKNPEAGGAEIYYHELFRRLPGTEFDITVLSHHFPGAPHSEVIDGIKVLRRGGKWLFNYEIIPYLIRNKNKYDLIIEDLNKVPFFTPLYLRSNRLHLVMHFFGKEIFRETLFPAALYVFCMEKLVPVFYRKERFIAISESTAQEIERFPVSRDRIGIVEPGIDSSFYSPTLPKSDPPVLAFMGRLMKYKNTQFVIRALARLREAIPGCTLEIGGAGEYLSALQHIAAQCNVAEQVKFLGRISEEEKRDLLSRASLFVNPSAKEGWGINNIEANLCGTVSLSSNVPGLRDSVSDGTTGLLYSPDDPDDFHRKAVSLLTDKELRATMEKAALERARGFDWNHMARKLADCLNT
ncbi:MAG: glycosyltransferase family 4 protein [Chitinispirillaceae bacterium]|nr:glycosyltransferase family 4 protein [Chitinispirillaceae bacterium]